MKNFSPRCAFCNLIIKDKAITALGQRWHAEHLTCAQCSKPYDGSNFFTKVTRLTLTRKGREGILRAALLGVLLSRVQPLQEAD